MNLGRDVALKLFAPQSADPDELRRQEAEIELLATLNHPSLVTLFDAGTGTRIPEEPRPFLTMGLVEGKTSGPGSGTARCRWPRSPSSEPACRTPWPTSIRSASSTGTSTGQHPAGSGPSREPLRPKAHRLWDCPHHGRDPAHRHGHHGGHCRVPSPEQSRGADLGPASDIHSLGWSCSNASRARSNTPAAPWNPPSPGCTGPRPSPIVPAEWADLIRSMTALDPWTGRPPRTSKLRCGMPCSPRTLSPAGSPKIAPACCLPRRPGHRGYLPPDQAPVRAAPTAPNAHRCGRLPPEESAAAGGAPAAHLLDLDAETSPSHPRFPGIPRRLPLPAGPPPHAAPAVRCAFGARYRCRRCRRRPRCARAARRRPLSGSDRGPWPAPAGTAEERGTMKLTTRAPSPAARPRSPRPLLTGWVLGAVLLVGTLAGCAPAPELDRDAARQLQSTVLAALEAAAANDPAASLKRLDELVLTTGRGGRPR